jgi:hypothetical protein
VKAKAKRGISSKLVGYFYAYPDKVITADELERYVEGEWDRAQILQAMTNFLNPKMNAKNIFNGNLEKLQVGVWRLNSKPDGVNGIQETQTGEQTTTMTVEVIRERANYLLVEDTEDQKIYKMYLVG